MIYTSQVRSMEYLKPTHSHLLVYTPIKLLNKYIAKLKR